MSSIILLSGPVAAGKTTVAHELLDISPGPITCIEGDKFWPFIVKAAGGKPGRNSKMIMTAMMASAVIFARYGYDAIIDFSIGPWFLETAFEIASRKEIPLHYIILQPSEKTCAHRAATRAERVITDYAKYHGFYDSFNETQAQRHVIPGDDVSVADMALRVREAIDEGTFLVNKV